MAQSGKKRPAFLESKQLIEKYGQLSLITDYLKFLLDCNKKINLVSRETKFEDILRIAAGCLVPFEFGQIPSGRFIDIGTGSGFPSIILMLSFPGLEGVLIERTGKKMNFLQSVSMKFNLKPEIINADFMEALRKVDYSRILRESSFDYAFMKLVRPDKGLFLKIISLLKPGGNFIYYAPLDNFKYNIPDSVTSRQIDYYLDNNKQLRSMTIFSKIG